MLIFRNDLGLNKDNYKKSSIKIEKRDKIDIPNTHIHDHSFSWIGKGTSIKVAGLN